ncbi:MAG: hypothetical protein ACOC1U_07930 [Spirochaetota bacterium]
MVRPTSLVETLAGAVALAAVIGSLSGAVGTGLSVTGRIASRAATYSGLAMLDTSLLAAAARIDCGERDGGAPHRALIRGVAVGCLDGEAGREIVIDSCSQDVCTTIGTDHRRYRGIQLEFARVRTDPVPHLEAQVLAAGSRLTLIAPLGERPAP